MSLMPEFILQAVIARGFRTIRQDTRFLDQLFRNLTQKDSQEMRDFIRTKQIDLCINYPRDSLKLPSIVILLKTETENTTYLADSMGDETPDIFSYDGDLGSQILGGTASISSMSGQGPIEFGPFNAVSGTNNTLRIASNEWVTDRFSGKDFTINIVAGKGSGQQRSVVQNGTSVILVDKNWNVVPDSTSIFEVRAPYDEVLGEPGAIYDRRAQAVIERRGSLNAMSYQVLVMAPNPELAIYLTSILKSIFYISKIFLEKQGIINLQISSTDFLPRMEYQPDFAYLRSINLDFLYPFDVFEERTDLANQLRISLEGDIDGIETDLSQTTITLGPDLPAVSGDIVKYVTSAAVDNLADITQPVTVPISSLLKKNDIVIINMLRTASSLVAFEPPSPWIAVLPEKIIKDSGGNDLELGVYYRFIEETEVTTETWSIASKGSITIRGYRNVDRVHPILDKGQYGLAGPSTVVSILPADPKPGAFLIASLVGVSDSGSGAGAGYTQSSMDKRIESIMSNSLVNSGFDELMLYNELTSVRVATFPTTGRLIAHSMILTAAGA